MVVKFDSPISSSHTRADDDSFASERDAQPTDDQVTTFVFNRNHSSSIRAQREALPIFQHRDQILYCLENYQTLVLVGETGCGKSTQVPQVRAVYSRQYPQNAILLTNTCVIQCLTSDLSFIACRVCVCVSVLFFIFFILHTYSQFRCENVFG